MPSLGQPPPAMWSLTSDAFADEPEEATEYFTALGRTLVLWGRSEANFDYALAVATSLPGTAGLAKKGVPGPIAAKCELFKKLVCEVPLLEDLASPVDRVLSRIEAAANCRHYLVHGNFDRFIRQGPLTARFVKRGMGSLKADCRDISLTELKEMADTCRQLDSDLLRIAMRLHSKWPLPEDVWEHLSPSLAAALAHRRPQRR